MKEGKKGVIDRTGELPVNYAQLICDECGGQLIKLETYTDLNSLVIEDEGRFYFMYWKCICSRCGREVLVLEAKCKFSEPATSNKGYFDRGEVSGR